MKRSLDKWIVLGLLLVLLTGTLVAQAREGLQFAAYPTWANSREDDRLAYINGVMSGAYYVAITYMLENPGKGLPAIDHLIPRGINVGDMATLIATVYRYPENREIATVAIICNWRKYYAMYGGF
jgi:hypothetical protein